MPRMPATRFTPPMTATAPLSLFRSLVQLRPLPRLTAPGRRVAFFRHGPSPIFTDSTGKSSATMDRVAATLLRLFADTWLGFAHATAFSAPGRAPPSTVRRLTCLSDRPRRAERVIV